MEENTFSDYNTKTDEYSAKAELIDRTVKENGNGNHQCTGKKAGSGIQNDLFSLQCGFYVPGWGSSP